MVSLASLLVFVKEFALFPLLLGYTLVKTLVQYIVRGFHPLFPKWTLRFEIANALKRAITERYGESLALEPTAGRFRRVTEVVGTLSGWFACREHGTRVEPELANGLEHLWIKANAPAAEKKAEKSNRFVVLYYHGGGYVVYSPRYFITYCNLLRSTILRQLHAQFPDDSDVELDFFIANYRKAPLHPFPTPAQDGVLAYEYLVQHHKISPRNIILAGDSAGGGLVMSTLLRLRDATKTSSLMPLAAVLTCPFVDMSPEDADFVPPPFCGLSQSVIGAFRHALLDDPTDPASWRPHSVVHSDLRNLSPVFVQAAELDYIYNNATRLIEKAKADGVIDWELDIHDGVPHVFTTTSPSVLPYAMVGVQNIAKFAAKHIHSSLSK